MFIKYFIPEDGDDQAHPNVFKLDSAQPTFSEVRKAFPVPGTYHFRFLKNAGSHIVWLDVTDDSSALPTHQGAIFMKVSRISAPTSPSHPTASDFVPSPTPNHQPAASAAAAPTAPATVSPPAKAPKPHLEKLNSEKLIKFDDDITSPLSAGSPDAFASSSVPIITATPAPATVAPDNDLLGINSSTSSSSTSKPAAASAASADFFGMETLKPTTAGPMSAGSSGVHSTRSMSPMAGGAMNPMGGGMQGGMNGMNPMGGSMGGMQQGGMGGRGMGMGGMGMGAQPGRGGMGPGSAGYDPFSNIGSMQAGRGAGPMGGRR